MTEGPWRAEKNPTWGICVRGGTGIDIATGREDEGFIAFRLRSIALANLIAAGPEMQAALEAFVMNEDTVDGYGEAYRDGFTNALALARAAIAKATGEAQ